MILKLEELTKIYKDTTALDRSRAGLHRRSFGTERRRKINHDESHYRQSEAHKGTGIA